MSILDRILGRQPEPTSGAHGGAAPAGPPTDEQAVERYRYLLRTAPPEAIEEAHAEAFAQLTPEQRRLALEGLNGELPPPERADRDDPQSLARIATRAELRRPGTLERTFDGVDPRGGGGLIAGNFLNTVAAVVVGSAIAEAIFDDGSYADGYQDGAEAADADQGTEAADIGYEGGDVGYDAVGDIGGDFGGGEF